MNVGLGVGVRVTVGTGVNVGVGLGVGVRVTVGTGVNVGVGLGVGVRVTVGPGVNVGVGLGVGVRVTVGTGVNVGVGLGVGMVTSSAFAAFSLPPVATFPDRDARRSQDPRILLFICAVEIDGFLALSRAAVPVTYGTAIDVPFRYEYPPDFVVL